jgi:hypothetical protein
MKDTKKQAAESIMVSFLVAAAGLSVVCITLYLTLVEQAGL